MGLKSGLKVQLTFADFDDSYMLDSFPEDFECPLCMMVKLDLMECPKCFQLSCHDCNMSFSQKNSKTNVA